MKESAVERAWLGLYHTSMEDPWHWTDGSEVDYPNWGPGQPNDDGNELCALIQEETLHDYPCSRDYNYICQYLPSEYALFLIHTLRRKGFK